MKLEWFIARRYLSSSRKGSRLLSLITLISMGGVFVGVMALIIVTAVMTGLQTDLRDKILGTNPHIWLTSFGENMRLAGWDTVAAEVRDVPGVAAAAPFVHTEVMMRNAGGYVEGAILRGIDPSAPGEPITDIVRSIRARELTLGPTRSGHPPLLVGETLADNFAVYPGDVVTLLSPPPVGAQLSPLGGIMPTFRSFEVVGRFRTGMYEYDTKFLYTTLPAAQDVANLGADVTGLEIRVPDPDQSDRVSGAIEQRLGGFPYRTQDWKTMNASLFQALQLEKFAMGIILLLIVIVAAFNIVSTLVMVVTDKTREIGILKSMGLRASQVQRIFMLQGVVIGLVGSVLGGAAGLLVTWLIDRYRLIKIPGDVYFIDYLPVAFDWLDVTLILVLSLLISFVATLYPARQAAKLFPVEAIRHE